MHTINSKLRSLQYRILHYAIVCNKELKMWNIKDCDLCSFCNLETENMIHLFAESKETAKIIEHVKNVVVKYNNQHIIVEKPTKTQIIMNNAVQPANSLYNFVLLAAKSYIYSNK